MGFDAENFGLGLLAGWISAYGVYRARHLISSAVQSANQGAKTVQNSAMRSADSRYISDLIERCETTHLAGKFARLSDLLIEPRFLPAPELAAPRDDDDAVQDIYRVVPVIPDHPYLHAPYNVPTLSIDDLAGGDRALALLGTPGSGRTTALLAIALHSLGRIRLTAPPDKIQQRLEEAESALAEKERAVRVKERILIEQRAKERLATEHGLTYDAEADEQLRAQLPLFRRLMPVYVHCADLHINSGEFGAEADPAEPLVRAVQHSVRRVTASTIPGHVYSRLDKGQVLLLIDGYDDLPEAERPAVLSWLQGLLAQYRQNFIIVAGPVAGFGALTRLNLTPVFMRPWSDLEVERAATRWADAWVPIARHGGNRRASKPEEEAIRLARTNARALSPLEATLKIWTAYADDTQAIGVAGWMRAYLVRHKTGGDPLEQLVPPAALQLDEGYITSARLQIPAVDAENGARQPDDEVSDEPTLDMLAAASAGADADEKRPARKEESEAASAQGRLLSALERSGLLVRFRGDRYQLRHPTLAAYLASLTLTAEDAAAKINRAAWRPAIAFAAIDQPLDRLVAERMKASSDLLADNLIDMARWLAYAPVDAAWRGGLIRQLGNLLTQPNQYPAIRERAAAALLDTRDKNTLLVFRLAARSADADVRRLGCLGMGALGDSEALRDLSPLINDQHEDVQLAAGMGLGALRSEEALEAMIHAFVNGPDALRQTIAEAFAAMPGNGYEMLYEGINSDDMALRRAAIFGLRRLRTTWALIAIYRAFLEDEQWYVRSAAQEAFQEIQYGRADSLTTAYPAPESIDWLNQWAADRGEQVPPGEGGVQMLMRALQEGEAPIRALAAINLGQLGVTSAARALYAALRDGREEVRAAAHRALALLQLQIGEALPSAM